MKVMHILTVNEGKVSSEVEAGDTCVVMNLMSVLKIMRMIFCDDGGDVNCTFCVMN